MRKERKKGRKERRRKGKKERKRKKERKYIWKREHPGKTQIRLHCSSAQKLPKSVKSLDPHSGPWDRTHHTSRHHLSLTQQLAHWHCCGGLCTGNLPPTYKAGTLAPLSSLRLPFLSMDSLPQTPLQPSTPHTHDPYPSLLLLVLLFSKMLIAM